MTIRATGSSSGANTPGESIDHYEVGETVTFDNPANPSPASQVWTIESFEGQTTAIVNPTTSTPTLLIDAASEGSTARVQQIADGITYQVLIAVKVANAEIAERIPVYDEQDDALAIVGEATWNEGGNTEGWFPVWHRWLKKISAALLGVFRAGTAAQISALTQKGTPVGGDHLLIEDSADSNNKKRALVSTLPVASHTHLEADVTDLTHTAAGGAGTDTTAIHDNTAGEINAVASKATPVSADVILIEDSAASFAKKKATLATLVGADADAIHDNVAGEINAVMAKTTPVAADKILIEDSAASWAKKSATLTDLIGSSAQALSGALEYLDRIEVTGAAVQAVTFGFGGDGELNRALNGDSDETYVLEWYLPDAIAGTPNLELQPNGLTTNQVGARHYGGSTTGQSVETRLLLARTMGTAYHLSGRAEFHAKSGKRRGFLNEVALHGSSQYRDTYSGMWTDTTTVVTSLVINATIASAIKVGATFVLYRRKAQASLAEAADVPRGMEFIDKIIVGSDTQEVTFGLGGDGVYGVALDGDADEEYFMSWRLAPPSATVNYEVRPNGLATNLFGARHYGGSTAGNSVTTNWQAGSLDAGYNGLGGDASIKAKTGLPRFWRMQGLQYQGSSRWAMGNAGIWTDTTTLITSLVFRCDTANQLKAGSEIYLWRRRAIPTGGVVAKVALSADSSTISITGLDGDADGQYELDCQLLLAASAANLTLQFNSDAANGRSEIVASGATAVEYTDMRFATYAGPSSPHTGHFKISINASRLLNGVARARTFISAGGRISSTTALVREDSVGRYTDTASNLTVIDIVCSVASGILTGSQVTVRKI